MFLLEARSARIGLTDGRQMRTVVRELAARRYQGLVGHMLDAAERAADVPSGTLDANWLAPQPHSVLRRIVPEVFFADDSLFVLAPAGKRLDAWEVRHRDHPPGLDDFCAAVGQAVGPDDAAVEWRSRTLRLNFSDASDADALGRTAPGTGAAIPGDRAVAGALADDDARSVLTDLVQSGSSITDFADSPMSQYGSISELHRRGLIEREFLVVCRQDHRTLGRIGDMDDAARHSILQLSCPTCGRRFDEELLREVHSPSSLAIELVSDGRWRALWALSLLADHGIDERSISQLAGAGGNGLALRIDALHGRLLIELPATEFGMQHAYAMIRRLQRQNCQFGLVLATEPVADETHQYLAERVAHHQGPTISVLEGSRTIVEGIGEAMAEWSMISVRSLAEELIDTTGMDFGAVIDAWMRRVVDRGDMTGEIDLRTIDEAAETDEHGGATVTELSRALGQ